jgi:hypothetical protein
MSFLQKMQPRGSLFIALMMEAVRTSVSTSLHGATTQKTVIFMKSLIQDIRFPWRDSNRGLPEYEGMLIIAPQIRAERFSVFSFTYQDSVC